MRWHRLLLVPTLGSMLGLGLVVLPTVPTPSSAPPPAQVSSQSVTSSGTTVAVGWSKVVSGGTDLVGVQWQGDPTTTFTIEKLDQHGHWSSAGDVGVPDSGPDPGSPEARRRPPGNISDPVWLGDAKAVRVRVAHGSARGIDLHEVRVPRATAPANVASATAPRPAIIPRTQWGADESLRLANCPEGPDYDSNVNLAIVHHTGGSNNYGPGDTPAIMRGLYVYATQTLKYCDMHYNFLVDRYGQVFEGRYGGIASAVHGAHSVGFNTNSTGISTIGNFQIATPPSAMVNALERLLAWKLDIHGVNPLGRITYVTAGNDKFPAGTAVNVPTIIGHQDTWFTDCPGQYLEPLLPRIRSDVAAMMAANRSWSAWDTLGQRLTSAPAAASWGGNHLDVFARSTTGTLLHRTWRNDIGWSSWVDRGGSFTGSPTAVSWGPNRIDVFATASDGSLRHLWWDGTQWSAWENLGGDLASAPTVSSWGPNRLDVFARTPGGALQHKFWSGQWSGWETLGGGVVGDPTAVSWAPGRVDLFVRGTDNALWHRFYSGRWAPWEGLGGGLSSSPTVAAWGPNRLDVFVRGTDNALWHRAWDGSQWRGYASLGGLLTSAPAAVSKSWNRIDIFVRGTDNALWHRAWG